jgi:hypothetical protein
MRNGAYAGPVTDGKHVVTTWLAPSPLKRSSAGSPPARIAEASVSGRAPSARRMTTDNFEEVS